MVAVTNTVFVIILFVDIHVQGVEFIWMDAGGGVFGVAVLLSGPPKLEVPLGWLGPFACYLCTYIHDMALLVCDHCVSSGAIDVNGDPERTLGWQSR